MNSERVLAHARSYIASNFDMSFRILSELKAISKRQRLIALLLVLNLFLPLMLCGAFEKINSPGFIS